MPLPGAKLGLANLVTIILIYIFSWKEGMFNSVSRTILGSIIGGTILSPAFLFSLAGASVSTVVMALIVMFFKNIFSPVGVGIFGALGHNLAQLSVAILLASHLGLFALLPFLLFVSIITGFITGFISSVCLNSLHRLHINVNYQNI